MGQPNARVGRHELPIRDWPLCGRKSASRPEATRGVPFRTQELLTNNQESRLAASHGYSQDFGLCLGRNVRPACLGRSPPNLPKPGRFFGSITRVKPKEVSFRFDEVVAEKPASVTTLGDLFLISPRDGVPNASWHRDSSLHAPRFRRPSATPGPRDFPFRPGRRDADVAGARRAQIQWV